MDLFMKITVRNWNDHKPYVELKGAAPLQTQFNFCGTNLISHWATGSLIYCESLIILLIDILANTVSRAECNNKSLFFQWKIGSFYVGVVSNFSLQFL